MRLGKYLSSLTKPELEELTENCGFTDNELVIVKMLRNEKTCLEIANKLFLSVPTMTMEKLIEELGKNRYSSIALVMIAENVRQEK